MVGSAVGGKAMRAAGEAMGMSEAGVRTMEAGGELGGGLLAGRAGARYAAPRFGMPPATQAELAKMPATHQARYAAARATGFKQLDFGQPGARAVINLAAEHSIGWLIRRLVEGIQSKTHCVKVI